jgi:hypothetical protein
MRRLPVALTAAGLIILVFALTDVSAASPGHAVVAESVDERFVMVSGKDRDEVGILVNDAAARGYRLVAMSTEWRSWGMVGLTCLLKRDEGEAMPDRAYSFRFLNFGKLAEPLNTDASQGYRVLEWSLLDRAFNYLFVAGAWPLLVMERAPHTETVEYAMIVVQNRKKLLKAIHKHCAQHYRFAAFLGRGGQVIVIMQRPLDTGVPDNPENCDSGRFEFIETKAKDYPELADHLDDLASKGYRLLAAANGGFLRYSFSGAVLLEREDSDTSNYEYVVFDPREGIHEHLDALNTAGERGFHLHRLTSGLLVMEKPPGADVRSEYRLVAGESAQKLLDAVSAASGDGFRVERLCCDNMVLLERRQPSR